MKGKFRVVGKRVISRLVLVDGKRKTRMFSFFFLLRSARDDRSETMKDRRYEVTARKLVVALN